MTTDAKQHGVDLTTIRNNAQSWTLGADAQLLTYLETTSSNILSEVRGVHSNVDDLVLSVEKATSTANNVLSDFLMLANKQFVENRVYDEELILKEPSQEGGVAKNHKTKTEREAEFLKSVETGVSLGITMVSTLFDRVEIKPEDLDEDDDPTFKPEPFYEARDPYLSRALPCIIGSKEFYKHDHVGLRDEPEKVKEALEDDVSLASEEVAHSPKPVLKFPPNLEPPILSKNSDSSGLNEEESGGESDTETSDRLFRTHLSPRKKDVPVETKPVPASRHIGKPSAGPKRETSPEDLFAPPAAPRSKEFAAESDDEDSPFATKTGLFKPRTTGLFDESSDDESAAFAPKSAVTAEKETVTKPSLPAPRDQSTMEPPKLAVDSSTTSKPVAQQQQKEAKKPVDLFAGGESSEGEDDLFAPRPPPVNASAVTDAPKKPVGGVAVFGPVPGGDSVVQSLKQRQTSDSKEPTPRSPTRAPTRPQAAAKVGGTGLFDDHTNSDDEDLFAQFASKSNRTTSSRSVVVAEEATKQTAQHAAAVKSEASTVQPRATADVLGNKSETVKPAKKISLFDDSSDEDDLFSAVQKVQQQKKGLGADSKSAKAQLPASSAMFSDPASTGDQKSVSSRSSKPLDAQQQQPLQTQSKPAPAQQRSPAFGGRDLLGNDGEVDAIPPLPSVETVSSISAPVHSAQVTSDAGPGGQVSTPETLASQTPRLTSSDTPKADDQPKSQKVSAVQPVRGRPGLFDSDEDEDLFAPIPKLPILEKPPPLNDEKQIVSKPPPQIAQETVAPGAKPLQESDSASISSAPAVVNDSLFVPKLAPPVQETSPPLIVDSLSAVPSGTANDIAKSLPPAVSPLGDNILPHTTSIPVVHKQPKAAAGLDPSKMLAGLKPGATWSQARKAQVEQQPTSSTETQNHVDESGSSSNPSIASENTLESGTLADGSTLDTGVSRDKAKIGPKRRPPTRKAVRSVTAETSPLSEEPESAENESPAVASSAKRQSTEDRNAAVTAAHLPQSDAVKPMKKGGLFVNEDEDEEDLFATRQESQPKSKPLGLSPSVATTAKHDSIRPIAVSPLFADEVPAPELTPAQPVRKVSKGKQPMAKVEDRSAVQSLFSGDGEDDIFTPISSSAPQPVVLPKTSPPKEAVKSSEKSLLPMFNADDEEDIFADLKREAAAAKTVTKPTTNMGLFDDQDDFADLAGPSLSKEIPAAVSKTAPAKTLQYKKPVVGRSLFGADDDDDDLGLFKQ